MSESSSAQEGYSAKSSYRVAGAGDHYRERRFDSRVAGREATMVLDLTALCGSAEECRELLDAPCGTGRISKLFPDRNVTAVDISADMLQHAVVYEHVSGQVADVEKLPFDDASFDLVLSIRFLHHLPEDETVARCFAELARVSRRYLLVSYFDRMAFQGLRRRFKERFWGHVSRRISRSRRRFEELAREQGLRPLARRCSFPLVSEQWFVLFEKANGHG